MKGCLVRCWIWGKDETGPISNRTNLMTVTHLPDSKEMVPGRGARGAQRPGCGSQ